MNKTARRISTLTVIAAAAIFVAYAFLPKPLPVDIASAARGPMQITIDEDGQTRAHDRFTLAAPVAGVISRISLHEGDLITAGALVAVIHPLPASSREEAEIRARIASAKALKREADQQAARAETSHQQAMRDLRRFEELYRKDIIPRIQFEEAQTKEAALAQEVQAARERATAAAGEVKVAEAGLISLGSPLKEKANAIAIRAPVDGRILRIVEKSEGVVAAGAPIAILSNTNKIEIVADLISTDAVKVQPGAQVFVENWGGEGSLAARLRTVEPFGFTKVSALGIEEQRVNVIADFIDVPPALGDGYRVDVRIVIWESEDVLKVPSSALFRVGDAWNVFTVGDNVARSRRVDVGHRNAFEAEIRNGLDVGQKVIPHPSNDIKEGVAVKPRV
jgi:HlyD family secretion protein